MTTFYHKAMGATVRTCLYLLFFCVVATPALYAQGNLIADGGDDILPPPTFTYVNFGASQYSVNEGASGTNTVTVQVVLSRPAITTVTVDYTTEDYTANAGTDYQAANGTLTFQAGESQKSISFTVYGDQQFESDEFFRIRLQNPYILRLGTTATTLVKIWNDDMDVPEVKFSQTYTKMGEYKNTVNTQYVTIQLSETHYDYVRVNVGFLSSGTATPYGDFVFNSQQVTFLPGEWSKTVPININPDQVDDDGETVILKLSQPQAAILGADDEMVIEIENYTGPSVSFDQASVSVSEYNSIQVGWQYIGLSRIPLYDNAVAIRFSTDRGTESQSFSFGVRTVSTGSATPNVDYETSTYSFSSFGYVLFVPITNDIFAESNETFDVEFYDLNNATVTGPSRITVTILDDDGGQAAEDNLNDTFSSDLQVEEGMGLFPNPAQGQTTVVLASGLQGQQLNVIDMSGRTVASHTLNGLDRYTLNLEGLPKGLYMVHVTSHNGQRHTQTLQVR